MNNAKSLQDQLQSIRPLIKPDSGDGIDAQTRGESSVNYGKDFEYHSIQEEFRKVSNNADNDEVFAEEGGNKETREEREDRIRKENEIPIPLNKSGRGICLAIGSLCAIMAVACGMVAKGDLTNKNKSPKFRV